MGREPLDATRDPGNDEFDALLADGPSAALLAEIEALLEPDDDLVERTTAGVRATLLASGASGPAAT